MRGASGGPGGGTLGPVGLAAVAVGSLLGGGVLLVPKGVENLAGPVTPVSYLLAALAALALAAGYAVLASSPLGARAGGTYLHVSRVWDSRLVGFLAAWLEIAGLVAVLALLATWAGAGLAAVLAPSLIVDPPLVAVALLALVFLFHLHPRVAGAATAGFVGLFVLGVVVALFAAALDLAPRNFRPLLPTPAIREHPLSSVVRGALAAMVAFVGVDAAATLGGGATREDRRRRSRLLVASVTGVGLLLALVATATLGVIPWTRLVFVREPFAAAAAGSLGLPTALVVAVFLPLAAAVGLVALPWTPSRLLAGMGEVVPPLARTNRFGAPDASLLVVLGVAAALVATDTVVYALYLFPLGPAVAYAVHALSVAALPVIRPVLSHTCAPRLRPAALVGVGVSGLVGAGGLAWLALTLDPVATLSYSAHRPARSAVAESFLLVSPTRSVLPALLAWLTLGVLVYVAAGDYRDERGFDVEPTAALYRSGAVDGGDEADGDETGRDERDSVASDSVDH